MTADREQVSGEPIDEIEATYSVVELNSLVRDTLRRAHPDEVWVRGEVQNLSRSRRGSHLLLVGREGGPG